MGIALRAKYGKWSVVGYFSRWNDNDLVFNCFHSNIFTSTTTNTLTPNDCLRPTLGINETLNSIESPLIAFFKESFQICGNSMNSSELWSSRHSPLPHCPSSRSPVRGKSFQSSRPPVPWDESATLGSSSHQGRAPGNRRIPCRSEQLVHMTEASLRQLLKLEQMQFNTEEKLFLPEILALMYLFPWQAPPPCSSPRRSSSDGVEHQWAPDFDSILGSESWKSHS